MKKMLIVFFLYKFLQKFSEKSEKAAKTKGTEKEPNLEVSPKWNILAEILDEIKEANKLSANTKCKFPVFFTTT